MSTMNKIELLDKDIKDFMEQIKSDKERLEKIELEIDTRNKRLSTSKRKKKDIEKAIEDKQTIIKALKYDKIVLNRELQKQQQQQQYRQ